MTIYKDFSLGFAPHPLTGDVSSVVDERAVIQSIKNIVLTNQFERPFSSQDISGNITGLLFELADGILETTIKDELFIAIANYEPRATILDIITKLNPGGNSLVVTITFSIKRRETPVTFDLLIQRT